MADVNSATPYVVTYDQAWPRLYPSEAAGPHRVLAVVAPRIEHVGSTAVPGLMAKPIIDIMVGVVGARPPSTCCAVITCTSRSSAVGTGPRAQ